jgi:dihydrolipoamide dehydrogenase
MTLEVASARGIDAQEHRLPLSANARSIMLGGEAGAVHLVSEVGTELLLGVHAVGPAVGEITAAACIALEMGAVLEDVAATILPHPTVGEGFAEAALLGRGTPIHVPVPRRSSGSATTGSSR